MLIEDGILSQLISVFNEQIQKASTVLNSLLQVQAQQKIKPEEKAPEPVKALEKPKKGK